MAQFWLFQCRANRASTALSRQAWQSHDTSIGAWEHIEMLEAGSIPDWIVAIAAAAAAIQGWRSLGSWRAEAGGRRRIELAEELLAGFYEAKAVFEAIRSPFSSSAENEDREGRETEVPDVRHHRDSYYPILHRLTQQREHLAQTEAKKFRAQALLGDEILEPFNKLNRAYAQVLVSAEELYHDTLLESETTEEQRTRRKELRRMVWQHDDNDVVGILIKSAISDVETILRPLIRKAVYD